MLRRLSALAVVAALTVSCASGAPTAVLEQTRRYDEIVDLPIADLSGSISLERALLQRRSHRDYTSEELPLATLGQLFWAGQGVTDDAGHRTAPSAGALYPLELYAVTATTFGHYLPAQHRVEQRSDVSTMTRLTAAAFDQEFVASAPAVLVITGVQVRTEAKYGAAAGELMNREAGHAAQNVLLQASALDLAAVPVGGFDPISVARLLALGPGEEVLYLIPVGYPAKQAG